MKYKNLLVVQHDDTSNKVEERDYKPYMISNMLTQSDIQKLEQGGVKVMGDGIFDIYQSKSRVDEILGKNVFETSRQSKGETGVIHDRIMKDELDTEYGDIPPLEEPEAETEFVINPTIKDESDFQPQSGFQFPPSFGFGYNPIKDEPVDESFSLNPSEQKSMVIKTYRTGNLYQTITIEDKQCLNEFDVQLEQRSNKPTYPLAKMTKKSDRTVWYIFFRNRMFKTLEPVFKNVKTTHLSEREIECRGNYVIDNDTAHFTKFHIVKNYEMFLPLYDYYQRIESENLFDFERKMFMFVQAFCKPKNIIFRRDKTLWDYVKVGNGILYLDTMTDEFYKSIEDIQEPGFRNKILYQREKKHIDSFLVRFPNAELFKILSKVLQTQIDDTENKNQETLYLVGNELYNTHVDEKNARVFLDQLLKRYATSSPPLDERTVIVNLIMNHFEMDYELLDERSVKSDVMQVSWNLLRRDIDDMLSRAPKPDSSRSTFQVNVKTLSGTQFVYEADDTTTVDDLKNHLIQSRKNPTYIELFVKGKRLFPTEKLAQVVGNQDYVVAKRNIEIVIDNTKFNPYINESDKVSDMKEMMQKDYLVGDIGNFEVRTSFDNELEDSKKISSHLILKLYSPEPPTDTSNEPSTDTSDEPSTDTSSELSTDTSDEPSGDPIDIEVKIELGNSEHKLKINTSIKMEAFFDKVKRLVEEKDPTSKFLKPPYSFGVVDDVVKCLAYMYKTTFHNCCYIEKRTPRVVPVLELKAVLPDKILESATDEWKKTLQSIFVYYNTTPDCILRDLMKISDNDFADVEGRISLGNKSQPLTMNKTMERYYRDFKNTRDTKMVVTIEKVKLRFTLHYESGTQSRQIVLNFDDTIGKLKEEILKIDPSVKDYFPNDPNVDGMIVGDHVPSKIFVPNDMKKVDIYYEDMDVKSTIGVDVRPLDTPISIMRQHVDIDYNAYSIYFFLIKGEERLILLEDRLFTNQAEGVMNLLPSLQKLVLNVKLYEK